MVTNRDFYHDLGLVVRLVDDCCGADRVLREFVGNVLFDVHLGHVLVERADWGYRGKPGNRNVESRSPQFLEVKSFRY